MKTARLFRKAGSIWLWLSREWFRVFWGLPPMNCPPWTRRERPCVFRGLACLGSLRSGPRADCTMPATDPQERRTSRDFFRLGLRGRKGMIRLFSLPVSACFHAIKGRMLSPVVDVVDTHLFLPDHRTPTDFTQTHNSRLFFRTVCRHPTTSKRVCIGLWTPIKKSWTPTNSMKSKLYVYKWN